MTWGEVINGIRHLHFDFLNQFELPVQVFQKEVTLLSQNFPFPSSTQKFGEWEAASFPQSIADGLELHPIERVLLEGPILPIEIFSLQNTEQFNELYTAIFDLEKEWLLKTGLYEPSKVTFFEQNLKALQLRAQSKAGIGRLKVVQS